MGEFVRFCRENIRDYRYLAWGLFFAFLSAFSLGVGLLSMIPVLKLILDPGGEGRGLQAWVQRFNEGDHRLAIPEWAIEMVPAGRFEGVVFVIGIILFFTVFGGACNFLHQYCSISLAVHTIARVRAKAYSHVLRMPLSIVTMQGPSKFIARIIHDTGALQHGIIQLTSKAVAHGTKGLFAFIIAIVAGGWLIWIALIAAPIIAVLLRKFGKRIRRGTRGALYGQEALLRQSTETVQGLRAVKVNTAEARCIERFEAANKIVVHQQLRARTARAASSPIVEIVTIMAVSALAIVAVNEIVSGRLSIDRFFLSLGSLAIAGSSIKPLVGLVNEFQAASGPAQRLREVMDEAQEGSSVPGPALPRHERSIEFQSVTFTYATGDRPAVERVDLKIAHGERVAIVGPNGSGKTTLVSLVPRLLVPDSGRILIDGTDIASTSLASLRGQIGVVTEEAVLFRGTIAENIAFARQDASRDEIIEAAKRAHADSFINQMAEGYDADVFEQATSLSGGQRQRLAIARAILTNPAILILDEATSQIDAESEAEINAALQEFCRGRTSLIIAHRLSTVLNADRIIVMQDARVVDAGRHDELLTRCDLYARLNKTQLVAAV